MFRRLTCSKPELLPIRNYRTIVYAESIFYNLIRNFIRNRKFQTNVTSDNLLRYRYTFWNKFILKRVIWNTHSRACTQNIFMYIIRTLRHFRICKRYVGEQPFYRALINGYLLLSASFPGAHFWIFPYAQKQSLQVEKWWMIFQRISRGSFVLRWTWRPSSTAWNLCAENVESCNVGGWYATTHLKENLVQLDHAKFLRGRNWWNKYSSNEFYRLLNYCKI